MIHGLGTTIACACLAGGIGIGLFFVKHEVKEQEARLAELNREIQSGQESIHVLKAEWSYLNDPARLRALSEKYLSMKVMGPAQVASLDSLPLTGPVFAAHAAPAPVVAHVAPVPVPAPTPHTPAPHTPAQADPAPVVAKAEPAKPAAAPTKAAPVKLAQGKPTLGKPLPTKSAVAKPAPTPVAAKPPVTVAAAPRPVLYPGADTTPRGAAPAPRTVVVQSPALASTPALPGEVR